MPTSSDALAIAFQQHQSGRFAAAEQLYRQVLAADPNHAGAWHMLGVLNAQLGRPEAAVECLRRAIVIAPDGVDAHFNLGRILRTQRDFDEAAACYRRAIEIKPDYAQAHNSLGLALQGQGKLEEAAACHRRALELKRDYAGAHNNLGVALRGLGKVDEAVACFQRALELSPDFAAAHSNLGLARQWQGRLGEAVACFQLAVQRKPDFVEAHINLGNAWQSQGRLDEAAACYRRALELKPDCFEAHCNLVNSLQYRATITPKALAEAHAEFDARHCAGLRAAWRPHANTRDPERRLRVGFVSCDLRRHPVGYFLIRVLENLDQEQCEAICYHDATPKDELTARFQAAAAAWRDVQGWTDKRLSEQIRADGIDILFDLAGHTAGNRLLVFARKPAPTQITWIGYEGTTGLAAMDYILGDRYTIPADAEDHHRESVLRMPDGYICYDPPRPTRAPTGGWSRCPAPPVSPLPALAKGYVTFAAFHNPAKITPQVVEVWARVLTRLPEARLTLKYRGMDDAAVANRIGGLFADRGVERDRLTFAPQSDYADYLAAYGDVDIALDPFPFGGGITTCDALWMGVPVILCPGETFASRHGLSHLSNVGLTETIARDLDDYVELALSLADRDGRWSRLATLRAGLRERVAASPLCDGKRFATNFADILRGVWKNWCERG